MFHMRRKGLSISVVFVLIVGMLMVNAISVGAASVAPVFVAGNPSCTDLGYAFGFKDDVAPFDGSASGGMFSITDNGDGTIDWSSTVGVDAVIVKGGPNANVYVYDPPAESFGDTDLSTPINPNNGEPFGLSHVEFCFDYEVVVTKTAVPSFTRTYTWNINKSVDPAVHNLFDGETATSNYRVWGSRSQQDSNWAVSGVINISNPAPAAATVTGVTDVISDGINATVVCPSAFPFVIPAGGSVQCTYSSPLPDGSTRTNTATATTDGSNGVGGDSGSASVDFTGVVPTIVGPAEVNVTDNFNGAGDLPLGSSSGGAFDFQYPRTFVCPTNDNDYPNTATITETGQTANAGVTVNCYTPVVTKNANTSSNRTWTWTINKLASEDNIVLQPGDSQTFNVNYYIVVNATSSDGGFNVAGFINVSNPHPSRSLTVNVTDVVSDGINATVDCGGGSTQLVIAAGGIGVCSYSSPLPNGAARLNTAAATYQTELMVAPYSVTGTANVTFGDPTSVVDECISISDSITIDGVPVVLSATYNGNPVTFPIQICAPYVPNLENGRLLIEYRRLLGPFECDEHWVRNVASFITNDTGATGSDDHNIRVTVNCLEGCTLTQGYWKTHSIYGPAAHPDDGWYEIGPLGPNTVFFLSGKTWYQVFWTPPAGNQYYNLAHQYMAAKLNILNGASTTPAVSAAITGAETFFATYAPTSTISRAVRNQIIGWAGTLGSFNEGAIGPGHCSEDTTQTFARPR